MRLVRSRTVRAGVRLDGERKLTLLYGRGVERGDQTRVVQLFRGTRAALSLVRDGRTGEDQVGHTGWGVGNDHDESVGSGRCVSCGLVCRIRVTGVVTRWPRYIVDWCPAPGLYDTIVR